jgi:hypothetical protein
MISLEAIGARERIATFPPELDIDLLADFDEIAQPISLVLWEDVLATTQAAGRRDLEQAVEPMVAAGRRRLGPRPAAGEGDEGAP